MNELVVENNRIAPIKFNKEELKNNVLQVTQSHENVIYTEDTVADAKEELAKLRKQKKKIDQRRIEISQPYRDQIDDFKKEVDQILSLYDKAIVSIDKQVKDFEKEWKKERESFIQSNFNLIFADIKDIHFSQIKDDSWMRKNMSKKKIVESITARHKTISDELRTLNELVNEDILPEIRKEYFRQLKLSDALDKNKELMKIREKIIKRKEAEKKQQNVLIAQGSIEEVAPVTRNAKVSATIYPQKGVITQGSPTAVAQVTSKKMRMKIQIRAEKAVLEDIRAYILRQPGVEYIHD